MLFTASLGGRGVVDDGYTAADCLLRCAGRAERHGETSGMWLGVKVKGLKFPFASCQHQSAMREREPAA
jgi:hypothetical protein